MSAYFTGRRDDFADVELDLDVVHSVSARRRRTRCAASAYGETVTYGELAASPVIPARTRRGLVLCDTTASRSSCRATESWQRTDRRYGSLGADYKRRLLRSKVPVTLSEDVRNELAQIAPRRCDPLAEISGLFHTAGSLHLRGQGELAFHLDVSASSVARRAFSLLRQARRGERDPHVPATRV